MTEPSPMPRIVLEAGEIAPELIERCVQVVAGGGILVYPTDTIYGIGCDALNRDAVRRVYEIKRRPESKPMIVLIHAIGALELLAAPISPHVAELLAACWPGPLTVILRANADRVPWLAGASGTVGVRLPAHPFCRRLMEASGAPLLSTSANLSGEEYAGDIGVLARVFGAEADLLVDAGALPASPPSTIVDCSGTTPVLVREGALPRAGLARFLVRFLGPGA